MCWLFLSGFGTAKPVPGERTLSWEEVKLFGFGFKYDLLPVYFRFAEISENPTGRILLAKDKNAQALLRRWAESWPSGQTQLGAMRPETGPSSQTPGKMGLQEMLGGHLGSHGLELRVF